MAKDSKGKDRDLKKRLEVDNYMACAVRECYASFKNIINHLVEGPCEKEVIDRIFKQIDEHINEDVLIKELEMSALPNLNEQFVRLIKLLMENKIEDRNDVVILFQDMLEIVTRDIMKDQFRLEPYEDLSEHCHPEPCTFPLEAPPVPPECLLASWAEGHTPAYHPRRPDTSGERELVSVLR